MPTRILTALCLILILAASRRADATPQSSLLTIRVKDRHSGLPVNGAVVLLDGNVVAETGDEGAAKIEGIAPGRHQISVMSLSHDLSDESLRLEPGESRNVDFSMTPSTAETVTVIEKASVATIVDCHRRRVVI